MPDVFRCFTVGFRCSQLFSNVLRILLIDYRCSIDIPRCVQDVFRCSKTFKDVFRWSQMFLNLLQMFSRCSPDVQREGDIFEKMHFQFSFYRPQDQESMGCNVYFQNFLFVKWSCICLLNQPLPWDARSDSMSSTGATAQLSNDKHIFSVHWRIYCTQRPVMPIFILIDENYKITRLRKSIFLPTVLWS